MSDAATPMNAGAAEFDAVVGGSDLPVVVDFWAPWCAPCRAMDPIFADVARTLADEARFLKVNADSVPELASRYAVQAIPTILLLRAGREVRRHAGVMDAGSLARWVRGEIVPQAGEIEDARWYALDALPKIPPRFSISGHLIRDTVVALGGPEPGEGASPIAR